MDPMEAFDMERRTGVSKSDVDDFAERMDLISQAMEEIKNGTFDPSKCKIRGYKTPEQEEAERQERVKKEAERKKREDERKQRVKQEEHDNWWYKAKLRRSLEDGDGSDSNSEANENRSVQWATRVLEAYKARDANDYSVWDNWVPEDPVSTAERAEREAELEKLRNREFESNNPEFCTQFKKDLEERQRSQHEKERAAEKLKRQGNASYKRKRYSDAIESYMKALELAPFNVAVLANIAQCYLRQGLQDDCVEFCTRALFVDPNHVKALSRRANVWHQQRKLKEAAADMRKALALDPENPDVVEQHSIIVGDYEDSVMSSKLDSAIHGIGAAPDDLNSNVVEELRFVQEVLQKMDECHDEQNASTATDQIPMEAADEIVSWKWVAYELVLPVVERNRHVRDKLRTSGDLFRLCDRLCDVFEAATVHTTDFSHNTKNASERELIVCAMLNCVAAAVINSPRNQIVLYRHSCFRDAIFAVMTSIRRRMSSDASSLLKSCAIHASVVRVIEELVDSKAWRQAVIASPACLAVLLELVQLDGSDSSLSQRDSQAVKNCSLSASSICFTLSNEVTSVKEFNTLGHEVAIAISHAIQAFSAADSATLCNLLGFLTNLSSTEGFRSAVEASECECERTALVTNLLSIAHQCFVAPRKPLDYASSERALAALLNLSFPESSHIRRHDLLKLETIDTLRRILAHWSSQTFARAVCVLSRTVSLLCRLQVVSKVLDKNAHIELCEQDLSTGPLLSELYRICKEAISSHNSGILISDEIWQVCAQVWCHFGWCAHLPAVREFLRQQSALHVLMQAIGLANSQNSYRSAAGATSGRANSASSTTSTERLVGNIVKVMIALHGDHHPEDCTEFSSKQHLSVLVTALKDLPDGLARKNVAILLAKLCQRDSGIKDTIRSLRGIEMMMAVSQSLQKPTTLLNAKAAAGPAF